MIYFTGVNNSILIQWILYQGDGGNWGTITINFPVVFTSLFGVGIGGRIPAEHYTDPSQASNRGYSRMGYASLSTSGITIQKENVHRIIIIGT